MPTPGSDAARFAQALDRAGLSPHEFAERAGISSDSAYDLKDFNDEPIDVYSPADLKQFAAILGMSPAELLGIAPAADPITPDALAAAVGDFCRRQAITVEAFEDLSGWRVAASLADPKRFLDEYSIAGIRDVCGALKIEWERFIGGI
jgi:transcriptional regulator with XRE-family HTH domain